MFSKGNTVVIISSFYGFNDDGVGEIEIDVDYGVVKTWSKECHINLISPNKYGEVKISGYPRDNGIIYGWTIVRHLTENPKDIDTYIQEEVDKTKARYIESIIGSFERCEKTNLDFNKHYIGRHGNLIEIKHGESIPDRYVLRDKYINDINNATIIVKHFLDIPFELIKINNNVSVKSKTITTEYIKDYLEASDWGTGYKRTSKKNIDGKIVRTFENKLYNISVISDSNDENIEMVCPIHMKNPDGSINTTMNMFNYNIFYDEEFNCNILLTATDNEVETGRIDGVWGYEDGGFIPNYNTEMMEKIVQHISDNFSDVVGDDGEIIDTCEGHIIAIKDEYVNIVHKLLTEPTISVKFNTDISI